MVLGELGRAAADTRISLGVDEAALRFAMRFADIAHGEKRPAVTPGARDRRRAVEAAEYLEANADQPIALDDAASRSGLSSFHFLRVFSKVIGVSPHQYLVRARLRRAARWLAIEDIPITEVAYRSGFADLSNFVRTFHRAAGVSPRSFRRVARGDRKILQDRLDRAL
jgi:AraC-like DNA-binding protein